MPSIEFEIGRKEYMRELPPIKLKIGTRGYMHQFIDTFNPNYLRIHGFHVADDGRKCFLETKDGFEIVDEDFFEQPLITYIGNSQWGLAGGQP